MRTLKMTSKNIVYFTVLLTTLLACNESDEEEPVNPSPIEIAAKKACDCKSVSVDESVQNGKTHVKITVTKTNYPDFEKRTIKILKQIAKDVKGFCDTDQISINYVSNTYDIPDRMVYCECPEEKKPQATDSIILNLNNGITCNSSSSRIAKRESGQNVLILAIRDLDETVMSNDEALNLLKERLKSKYPQVCDSINEISFEFYTGEDGYRAANIQCQDL
ncbi:MAG: hypothetical protein MK066_13250 [Crocinitomicaceae bacterium]|nr:hypothetical protein [Crocinitomicaceae bacterium]